MDLISKPQWTDAQELAWATLRGTLMGMWESHYGDASFRQNQEAIKYGFMACRHFQCDWDDVLEMSLAASFTGDWDHCLTFVRRGWEMAQNPEIVQRLRQLEG
jgi:hypothetical protein